MTGSQAHAAIDAVVRLEWARLVASLAHYTGDVGLAEELAQDAVVAALEQWPARGVPDRPGAWLTTVAKRRAIDLFRRNRDLERKYDQIGRALDGAGPGPGGDLTGGHLTGDPVGDIDDDMLRLIFTACHPVLAVPARVALTLRLLGGLSTAEIARAYLVPEPTVAQRIVRAKKTLGQARVPFETPDREQRPARLASVLEVMYLVFNEGYSATAGDDWMRPDLCTEALRLGRLLAQLAPAEPEVHGLVALMEIQASRIPARTGPPGEPVLLLDQDRTRWDQLLISRGLAALARAEQLGGQDGPYALQAAIAACHARAFRPEDTDWARITQLYGVLATVQPSPVVELNRAVALSMASGPQAGLDLVDQLAGEPALRGYHLLASVRGDLLMKLGRPAEAQAEFERAAALTRNGPERELLARRARRGRREPRPAPRFPPCRFPRGSAAHDAQGHLAVAAVQLHQLEPQRQQRVYRPGGVRAADVGRFQSHRLDQLLGGLPGACFRGEEQGGAGQWIGEILPAQRVERADVADVGHGPRDRGPAVGRRAAHIVRGVDDGLARQGRFVLLGYRGDRAPGDGQHHHLSVLHRVADGGHRCAPRSLPRVPAGAVHHVVPRGPPLAAQRGADVPRPDHCDPHAVSRPPVDRFLSTPLTRPPSTRPSRRGADGLTLHVSAC